MKTKKIVVLIILFLIGYIVYKYYVSIHQNPTKFNNLIKAGNVVTTTATPTPTPTPTPIIIDSNSNLESEAEKLNPQDFSPDFNFLKEEANKL